MDLVLVDAHNTPRLMSMGNVQFLPVECVFGVIEVKSDLNSKARVEDGLNNIASFKRLRYAGGRPNQGFGILFAYQASLKWATLVEAVTEWQAANPAEVWPNLVVVLSEDGLVQMNGTRSVLFTEDIRKLHEPKVWSMLAGDYLLLSFYLSLMDLLKGIRLPDVPLRDYVTLPVAVGSHTVRFTRGSFSEVAGCPQHGDFLRRPTHATLGRILSACATATPIVAREAMDLAYGGSLGGTGFGYRVRIYNPEGHPLPNVLLHHQSLSGKDGKLKTQALGYEELLIDEDVYWLPFYYIAKHGLLGECPKCPPIPEIPEDEFTVEAWHKFWLDRMDKD